MKQIRRAPVVLGALAASLTLVAVASAHGRARAQTPGANPCSATSLASFMVQGELATTATVADVIEVSCNASVYGAGSIVTATSATLYDLCHAITWYVPGPKIKSVSGRSVKLKLDSNGNANVALIAGPKCKVGEALISIDENDAPNDTIPLSFKLLPAEKTPQGLYITPAAQVEDQTSGSVVTIAQAEFTGAAEKRVRIGAAQLFNRCRKGEHLVYVKENREVVGDAPELLEAIELDDDGNGFVLLIGTDSCAEGPSDIEADLEERPFTMITPMPTFTVQESRVR